MDVKTLQVVLDNTDKQSTIDRLKSELDALRAENAALRADAEYHKDASEMHSALRQQNLQEFIERERLLLEENAALMAAHLTKMQNMRDATTEVVVGLRAEIATLKAAQRWIPVEEKWPDVDAPVLALFIDGSCQVAWIDDAEDWRNFFGATPKPTHWQPLPTPPRPASSARLFLNSQTEEQQMKKTFNGKPAIFDRIETGRSDLCGLFLFSERSDGTIAVTIANHHHRTDTSTTLTKDQARIIGEALLKFADGEVKDGE